MVQKNVKFLGFMLMVFTLLASSFAFNQENLVEGLSEADCRQVGFEDPDLKGMVSNPLPNNFVTAVVDYTFTYQGDTIYLPICQYNYDAIDSYFRDLGVTDGVNYKVRLTSVESTNVNILKASKDNNRAIQNAYDNYNYLVQLAHLEGSVQAINDFDNELNARAKAGQDVGVTTLGIIMIIAGLVLLGAGGFMIYNYLNKKKKDNFN